jgi:HK97 family phage portal protein
MLRSLRPERRYGQVTPWGPWGDTYTSSTGINVDESTATQLLTVYGSVALIADTIATLPSDVFRNSADGPQDVPKPAWLGQPNSRLSFVDFVTQSLWSLLLDGNCYWAYITNTLAIPTEVTVLDPSQVDVRASESGGVEYWVRGQLFRGRLLHIKGIMQPGAIKGVSPIEAARQSIGLGLAAQEFASRFYSNGAHLSGFISTDADLTEEQAKKLQRSWSSVHAGLENAHRPGVLDNGATWNTVTVTPEQAQFLQTRNFQSAEIAGQLFLLDPTLLGIAIQSGQNLTYANLEQRGVHLVQFTLLRWIIRLEAAITSLLPRPQYFKFNVSGLERADLATRYAAHRIALGPNVPWETVAEVRSFEDLPTMPGTDGLPEPPAPAAPQPVPADPQTNHHHITVNVPETQPFVHVEPRIEVSPTPLEPVFHNHVEAPNVEVRNELPELSVTNVLPEPQVTVNNDVRNIVEPTPVEIVNHVEPTPVEVHNHQDPATVEVTNNLPETQVNVDSPVVNLQPQIDVQSPVVNMRAAPIRIDAPQVNMPKPGKIRRTFEKDGDGVLVAIVEEPIDDEPEETNESD